MELMALLLLSLPSAVLALAASPQAFRAHDLGGPQAVAGDAWRLVDAGLAAGAALATGAPDYQGVIYAAAGPSFLPNLPGDEAGFAYDVTASGEAVGESDDVVQVGHQIRIYPHAVLWRGGQPIPLTQLITGGDPMEPQAAYAVNEQGWILGSGRLPGGSLPRTFLLRGGIVTDLGTLVPGGGTAAGALSERGQVVGTADAAGGFDHAYLWENGVLTDLHDFQVLQGRVSSAWDVNEAGQIAGGGDYVADLLDYQIATLWDHGVVVNLGKLAGEESWARGINDHGVIAGGALNGSLENVAVMWKDGALIELNPLVSPPGWHLLIANDIDNAGRILATGSFQGGALRPVVLVPDCDGGYTVYGQACAGSGGFLPYLVGMECPLPAASIRISLVQGLGGAAGLLLAGTGTGVIVLAPGCDLQILPLLPRRLPITLAGAGAGAGYLQLRPLVPPAAAGRSLYLQAVFKDPGGPSGLTVSNPLQVRVP